MIEFQINICETKKKRIDSLISENTSFSRRTAQNLIKNGLVTINEKVVLETDQRVYGTTLISIRDESIKQQNKNIDLIPQNIELNIVFEDDDIIVLNKQAGIVCHPSCGHPDTTLVNALLFHCHSNLSDFSGYDRLGIVHRLDKDTSGLMIIAKNNEAHAFIAEQFVHSKGEHLKRKYICFVFGKPKKKHGIINTLIGRHPKFRQQNSVLQFNGKIAITEYDVNSTFYITSNHCISEVECDLFTGRTHQIRVHMQHIGNCVIGDPIYRPKRTIPSYYPDEIKNLKRQALHSYELSFLHPRTKEVMTFTAPLPQDLVNIKKLFTEIKDNANY